MKPEYFVGECTKTICTHSGAICLHVGCTYTSTSRVRESSFWATTFTAKFCSHEKLKFDKDKMVSRQDTVAVIMQTHHLIAGTFFFHSAVFNLISLPGMMRLCIKAIARSLHDAKRRIAERSKVTRLRQTCLERFGQPPALHAHLLLTTFLYYLIIFHSAWAATCVRPISTTTCLL